MTRMLKLIPCLFLACCGPVANAATQPVPVLQEAALPVYPPIAKVAQISGKVSVRVTVKGGKVVETKVISKLSPAEKRFLETPTIENLKTWRFNADVNEDLLVTYTYEISGKESEHPTNARIEMLPSLDVKITAPPLKPVCTECVE